MKHQSVPGGKKLVVRESDSPRPELQSAKTGSLSRSITLASSSMSSVVQRRELDRKRRDMLSAAPLEHAVVQRADDRVMKSVPVPEPHRLATNALFGDDGKPVLPLLRTHFSHEGKLTSECAIELIHRAKAIFRSEPNIVTVDPPSIVVGDLHGQFHDLLSIFEIAGMPQDTHYVFMGDYVDRGDFSTETIFYLLAIKISSPDKVTLLRGNHETRLMCEYFTTSLECDVKYDNKVYKELMDMFDCLPLASIIKDSAYGDCMCVHGGIGPDIHTLNDINSINRFREPPSSGPFCDLLWSDPVDDYSPSDFPSMTNDDWDAIEFLPNVTRHSSYMYGMKAVAEFLDDNDLACIIRAHQVQNEGYREHFVTEEDPIAMVLTIFSAPDYCGEYGNKGAFLLVMKDRFEVQQIRAVQHPFYLPDFSDAITFTLPIILESIVDVLQQLVMELKTEPEKLTESERRQDEALADKTKRLLDHNTSVSQSRQQYRRILDKDYHKNMPLFLDVLKKDAENEAFPVKRVRSGAAAAGALKRCSSGFL